MEDLQKKIELIRQISQFHPASGTDKGWSTYTGGMADSGEWFFWKMYDNASIIELQSFLDLLIRQDEASRSQKPPTREQELKRINKFLKEQELRLIFGDRKPNSF